VEPVMMGLIFMRFVLYSDPYGFLPESRREEKIHEWARMHTNEEFCFDD
jgi:hypothetical protein